MRLRIVLAVVAVAAFVASPSTARTGPAPSEPQATSAFTITLSASGLEPRARYGAVFLAEFDTGRTYRLGYGTKRAKADGSIQFDIDAADLGYYNRGEQLREVEMCVTEPEWPYDPVVCTERDIGY